MKPVWIDTQDAFVEVLVDVVPAPHIGPPEVWVVSVWWWVSRGEQAGLRRKCTTLRRAQDVRRDYIRRARSGEWGQVVKRAPLRMEDLL